MTTTTISANAVAAREASRSSGGQFGVQSRTGPSDMLDTPVCISCGEIGCSGHSGGMYRVGVYHEVGRHDWCHENACPDAPDSQVDIDGILHDTHIGQAGDVGPGQHRIAVVNDAVVTVSNKSPMLGWSVTDMDGATSDFRAGRDDLVRFVD